MARCILDTKTKLKHASSPEPFRDPSRIQEVVLGMGAGAGATQGVLGHLHTLGNRTRRSVADGCARVPEVLTATNLQASSLG